MSTTVEYVPCEPPRGPFRSTRLDWSIRETWMLGAYRVRVGDFVAMFPHSAELDTVGAWPVDLDLNPDFADHLIEQAKRLRDQHNAK